VLRHGNLETWILLNQAPDAFAFRFLPGSSFAILTLPTENGSVFTVLGLESGLRI
jgi:hypothetical protein